MPDMPKPPKTRHPWEPYPYGHALYCDKRTHQELVEGNITVVDAANAADPAQDGTFEHPYASIGQAVELAGENSTIFVREGLYREEVVLRPGQRLTGHLHPPTSSPYTTRSRPLIAPEQVSRRHREKYGAVVTMPENTMLVGIAVATPAPDTAAVWVEPTPGCRDSYITLGENDLYSAHGDALRLYLQSGGGTGRVTLWYNSIMTTKADSKGFVTSAMCAVFAPDAAPQPCTSGGKLYDEEEVPLEVIENRFMAPVGVCLQLDQRGGGDLIKVIDNVMSGYQGISLNLDAGCNRIVMLRNTVCAAGRAGSAHNFKMIRKPPPDEVVPEFAPVGVFVDDRAAARHGKAATVEMRDNNIVATDAFACGIRLREPVGCKEHLLDFARVAEQNHVHAQGEASRVFFGSIWENGREKVWLDEPGAELNMKPGDHRHDESH